ncbi:unnamed protein product [Fusarium venenatum]|uniref:Uncharacterized protein n=1 Tax=Fusarium venenatum TaxID=56646 RepID=A0A2L2TUK3_9HYPO|nr:LOW QUALITY PROTEIN: uncharacterized protein FVRRES_10338 [Fusarium venenatum]CEI70261.1 unnamed protein product [Fusarium venenatum]
MEGAAVGPPKLYLGHGGSDSVFLFPNPIYETRRSSTFEPIKSKLSSLTNPLVFTTLQFLTLFTTNSIIMTKHSKNNSPPVLRHPSIPTIMDPANDSTDAPFTI